MTAEEYTFAVFSIAFGPPSRNRRSSFFKKAQDTIEEFWNMRLPELDCPVIYPAITVYSAAMYADVTAVGGFLLKPDSAY
jgi:hypothetical protein